MPKFVGGCMELLAPSSPPHLSQVNTQAFCSAALLSKHQTNTWIAQIFGQNKGVVQKDYESLASIPPRTPLAAAKKLYEDMAPLASQESSHRNVTD